MKHVTTIASLLFFIFLFSIQPAAAQLVQVRIDVPQPRVVVIERPVCPSPNHAWVEGHYVYDSYSRRDVWVPGQWVYVAPQGSPRRYDRYDYRNGRGRDYAPGQRKKKGKHYYD